MPRNEAAAFGESAFLKFHLEQGTGLNTFTGYGNGYVVVNNNRHERNLAVLPESLLDDWTAGGFDGLAADDFTAFTGLGLEIVLLGTGSRIRFPRPELLRPLIEARIGVEVMDTPAACRTYNILMSEGRKVAAALILAD
jgi:uncharacterized protein